MLVAITLTLVMVFTLTADLAIAESDVAIPTPVNVPEITNYEDPEGHAKYIAWLMGHGGDVEWSEFHADAYDQYADEFTALFNSYEIKRAKTGRIMIRPEGARSFKFARTMKYVKTIEGGIVTSEGWEL